MFLRIVKTKGIPYLVLVESYWKDGKPRQRCVACLGRLDRLKESGQLEKIGMALLKYSGKNRNYFDIRKLREKDRKIWGAPRVIRKIWDRFKLEELFNEIKGSRRIKFDFFSSVFLMVMDRLISPQSKLKSYEKQDRYYGIHRNELQHLYRALDLLEENKEKIEEYLFKMNKDLFNMSLDIVFYDVTTFYFESIKRDELRDFGFSKDLKVNEVQVLLGLLIDREGRPIGYDIFPGNTFEGKTVKEILSKLKNRFNIRRVIFVGDKAMLSKKNLELISSFGYEYIVGYRMRQANRKIKEKVFEEQGYIGTRDEDGELFKYKEIDLDGQRIICAYSSKRAKRDRKERERLIEKAKEIIEEGKSVVSRRGARRYIEIKYGEAKIDEKRIKEDEKFDGYYAVITNARFLKDEDVLEAYHDLWRIEDSFRVFKSHIEARPIFHFSPRRIKGHFVLCFLAFLIERTLELALKERDIEYSPQKIREALESLQFSEIEVEGKEFYLRAPVKGLARDILRIFNIKIPPAIASPEDF